jgi:glutamine synthetase
LSNFKTTPLALKARASKQALDLFSDLGIMNHIEEARYEIELEEYTKKIQIEGRGDIATNHVIPTATLSKHFD